MFSPTGAVADAKQGFAVLANPKSGAKTVGQFMAEGMPFPDALKKTMAQLKGKSFATAPQIDNLGAARKKIAGGLEIAALDGLVQFRGGGTVDGGPQFRPAFEAIRSRQHELGVVQGKGLGACGSVICRDFGDSFRS